MTEQMPTFPRETMSLMSVGPTYFAKCHLSMLAVSLIYEAPHPPCDAQKKDGTAEGSVTEYGQAVRACEFFWTRWRAPMPD